MFRHQAGQDHQGWLEAHGPQGESNHRFVACRLQNTGADKIALVIRGYGITTFYRRSAAEFHQVTPAAKLGGEISASSSKLD
jgi:hypothetical protein